MDSTDGDPHPELRSEITCPRCHHRDEREMRTDSCLYFHECEGCRTLLRPKAGDCCVFCSYGSVPCPPVQIDRLGSGGGGCCGLGAPSTSS